MYAKKKLLRQAALTVTLAVGICQMPAAAWAVSSNVVAETEQKK